MMQAVRARLTAARSSLVRPERRLRPALWLVVLALGFGGCVGGQSGAEDFCDENQRDTRNPFATQATDEDSGAEEDDAGVPNELVADDGPEAQSGPNQCPPPD